VTNRLTSRVTEPTSFHPANRPATTNYGTRLSTSSPRQPHARTGTG